MNDGFHITGFDPMNIVKRGQEIIHKNFLQVQINHTDHIIKGPVKTIIGGGIFDVKEIEW